MPLSWRDLAPGGEDPDVCDLARSRRVNASLHPKRVIPVICYPRLTKEVFNLLRGKAKPHIGMLLPHPFVGMLHLVREDNRTARTDDTSHVFKHGDGSTAWCRTILAKAASTELSAKGSPARSPTSSSALDTPR